MITGKCPLFEWVTNQEVENMYLEREDKIEDEDTDILIINKGSYGINIGKNLDEGNE